MMKTLRGRLTVATLILVSVGLLIADTATYALLRSSLVQRMDRQLVQLASSRGFLESLLGDESGGRAPDLSPGGGPAAAVVMLLDPTGAVVRRRAVGFARKASLPVVPRNVPGANVYRGSSPYRVFSTGSRRSGQRYRALAGALTRGQGTLVVALPLDDVLATLGRLLLVEGIVTVTVIAGVAALALWLIRLGLRPLTLMEITASEIAEGSLSRRVEQADPHSEVGRLGSALNTMLERIEASFAAKERSEARLRRFVADASHELRTPLTSIRGYAELFRHGAASRPADAAMSIRRIEEESVRMSALVDELLLLARLDQGRPLDRSPVDVAAIVSDAVADARAVDPARPIVFQEPQGPEASLQHDRVAVVFGDEARLRQVVGNLLTNALHHTPAGTPIRVAVATKDDVVTIEVADDGPGLDAETASKIFDRFYRVDESRSRDGAAAAGGAGLGLSIVAAIVQAHGGQVAVQTAPGAGARFMVSLPRGEAAPEQQEQEDQDPAEIPLP